VKFTCQGSSRAVTVKATLCGPVQVWNAAEVTVPMPLPGSPLPALSFPDTAEDGQMPAFPDRPSIRRMGGQLAESKLTEL
jgi:hypothetical protein